MKIPKYPVSVKAVITRNKKFLMIKKKKNGKIDFSFPGGLVEKTESLEDALKREVKEEIGLEIEPLRVIHATKYKHPSGSENVGIYFLCKPKSGKIKLGREKDQKFLKAVWVDEKDDIPKWAKDLIIKFKYLLKDYGAYF